MNARARKIIVNVPKNPNVMIPIGSRMSIRAFKHKKFIGRFSHTLPTLCTEQKDKARIFMIPGLSGESEESVISFCYQDESDHHYILRHSGCCVILSFFCLFQFFVSFFLSVFNVVSQLSSVSGKS